MDNRVYIIVAMETVKLLLPITDAAAACGLGRSKFYELIGAGEIRVVKVGRRSLVPWTELEDFVDRLKGSAGTPPDSD
jgi:excisionase family DNA binding protein